MLQLLGFAIHHSNVFCKVSIKYSQNILLYLLINNTICKTGWLCALLAGIQGESPIAGIAME